MPTVSNKEENDGPGSSQFSNSESEIDNDEEEGKALF